MVPLLNGGGAINEEFRAENLTTDIVGGREHKLIPVMVLGGKWRWAAR